VRSSYIASQKSDVSAAKSARRNPGRAFLFSAAFWLKKINHRSDKTIMRTGAARGLGGPVKGSGISGFERH
jgi:hypothetical protein